MRIFFVKVRSTKHPTPDRTYTILAESPKAAESTALSLHMFCVRVVHRGMDGDGWVEAGVETVSVTEEVSHG